MLNEITIVVKQGQHVNTVLDALLSAGFELVGKAYTHGGRELHVVPPAIKVDHEL